MHRLCLLRHGASLWNQQNRFTGWTDIDLSSNGIQEAICAGERLCREGYVFDEAHTSFLTRAQRTLDLVIKNLKQKNPSPIPITQTWRLNERHYGALQGLNKQETIQKYGEKQVMLWRRSVTERPPPLDLTHQTSPRNNPLYTSLADDQIPQGESLKDVLLRLMPYWNEMLAPRIRLGKRLIVVAHGNTLRALLMHLQNLSHEDVIRLNLPTGIPIVLELNNDMQVTKTLLKK